MLKNEFAESDLSFGELFKTGYEPFKDQGHEAQWPNRMEGGEYRRPPFARVHLLCV